MAHFNYTHRLALALLDGRLGIEDHPSWLNELVLIDGGRYYTGNYCLGAILSVIPFLFVSPHCLTAVIAGMCVFSFFMLGRVEEMNLPRRMMLALFPVFGTWTWTNLGNGGAWDLSQGFGMAGQAGALYFTLVQRKPVVAGSFFALAFGNRAELILTLPIYLFLMKRDRLRFLIVPAVIALATAGYNFARFGSPFEFGYHRQNLMREGWCQHGLFSIYPVAYNAYHMLFEGLIGTPTFPFMQPSPWGCSIFLASPFLFLLFREGGKIATKIIKQPETQPDLDYIGEDGKLHDDGLHDEMLANGGKTAFQGVRARGDSNAGPTDEKSVALSGFAAGAIVQQSCRER